MSHSGNINTSFSLQQHSLHMSLGKAVFPQSKSCSWWKNRSNNRMIVSWKDRGNEKSDGAGNQERDGKSRPDVMLKRIMEIDCLPLSLLLLYIDTQSVSSEGQEGKLYVDYLVEKVIHQCWQCAVWLMIGTPTHTRTLCHLSVMFRWENMMYPKGICQLCCACTYSVTPCTAAALIYQY